MENNFASFRWETTRNIDFVDLEDLKQFSMDDSAPRKQKSTDFILLLRVKKLHQLSNINMTDLICNIEQKNMFYSERNSSKLCTEGEIGNLMNVLHCPQNEVKQFWAIVQSPMHLILQTLGESSMPKVVLKSGGECDSIQKKSVDFFVKKSSSAPQACSKSNALKTCKKRSSL
jgi:hypothetical protein